MATATLLECGPRYAAPRDEVLFTGTAEEVKAYCQVTFGPDEGSSVIIRTPEELDALLGADAGAHSS